MPQFPAAALARGDRRALHRRPRLGVNPSRLAAALHKTNWRIALLMIPVTIATYVLRGTAWWLGLRKIGERISLTRCLAIEFAGQVMIFLPMGDLARVAMARRAAKSPPGAGKVAGTIAFQELVYLTLVGLGVLPRVFTPAGYRNPRCDHDDRACRGIHDSDLEEGVSMGIADRRTDSLAPSL